MIASVIAALAAVATLIFTIRTSRWSIRKRIARKEIQIQKLENRLFLLQRRPDCILYEGALTTKMRELQDEIDDLYDEMEGR